MSRSLAISLPAALGLLGFLAPACSDSDAPACEDGECESVRGGATGEEDDKPDAGGTKRDAGSAATTLKDAGSAAGGANVPCDVKPLIDKYCSTCHGATPAFSAPMPLVTAADFQAKDVAKGKTYADLANTRLNASEGAMPPVTSAQPSADEKAVITKWLTSGAKGTNASCSNQGGSNDAGVVDMTPVITADEDLECYKLTAHANGDLTKPFPVGIATDAYFNFTFAPPWKGTVYGVTISPVVDNKQAIHHWLLFEDDVAGLPSDAVHEVGAHPGGQLLMGWAPGGESFDFRETGADVGLELPGNTTYTIEFHYNSSDLAATDASGVQICVEKRKPANIAGLSWLGYDQLGVPSQTWTGTCRPTSQQPIHVLAVIPHMHLQGRHMKGVINRKGGTTDTLHDEDFDFNYQKLYKKDVVLNPGDTITTTCSYAKPMSFGESTSAEMCYLFTMAYPKGALAGLDLWGSFAHGGSSCLGQ